MDLEDAGGRRILDDGGFPLWGGPRCVTDSPCCCFNVIVDAWNVVDRAGCCSRDLNVEGFADSIDVGRDESRMEEEPRGGDEFGGHDGALRR